MLLWFKDYLTDRKQRVVIRGQSSEWGDIMAGVPQGSSLGPLAFLIYINDLANVVTCNLKLFADDTCLYVTVDDPNSSAAVLNSNLENIKLWADQWLVNFNPKKTKSMTFSNKNVIHPPVHFQNKIIDDVEQHKHLGLTFNTKLNWNDHISNIISSVSKLLDVLQKLSKEIDRKSLVVIYHTFVRSKMEYACIVWDDCSEQNCQVLENCQLRAARIITGAKKGTSHNKLYAETQWPELEERRAYFKLCFMHKVVHKSAPDYLVDVLPNVANAEKHYNLRNNDDLDQFTFKIEKFRKSLFPDCVRKWNRLDKDTRAVVSHNSFKNKIVTDKCPPSLFYLGQRKFNIIRAQLRMNCSNLSAHLYSLHVVNSPACICSHTAEDTAHYFLDCPLYYTQRMILRNVVTRYTQSDLNVLLYGDSGIDHDRNAVIVQAVHDYILGTLSDFNFAPYTMYYLQMV